MANRVVLGTCGSLGDVHPFIAVPRALQARDVAPPLAVQDDFVGRCEAAGVAALAFMPGIAESVADCDAIRTAENSSVL